METILKLITIASHKADGRFDGSIVHSPGLAPIKAKVGLSTRRVRLGGDTTMALMRRNPTCIQFSHKARRGTRYSVCSLTLTAERLNHEQQLSQLILFRVTINRCSEDIVEKLQ